MKNIKKDNIKLSLITVVMILILVMGILFIINPNKYTSFIFRNEIIIFVIGISAIVFSIYCIYQFGSILFNKNAVFSINNKGINDNVNILNYPFVKWEDVLKIEECNINGVSHLKIIINNPEQYMNQKIGFKKWIFNFNYKKYQTPILLNNTYLKCSFSDFKKDILDFYSKYNKS